MNVNKPVTILREEFITSLVNLINNSGLPAYVMEPILKDIYVNLNNLMKQQLEEDKVRYAQMLKEAESSFADNEE